MELNCRGLYRGRLSRQPITAKSVTVKTFVSRIGNSSFRTAQTCWQAGNKTAEVKTTLVHYDYSREKAARFLKISAKCSPI